MIRSRLLIAGVVFSGSIATLATAQRNLTPTFSGNVTNADANGVAVGAAKVGGGFETAANRYASDNLGTTSDQNMTRGNYSGVGPARNVRVNGGRVNYKIWANKLDWTNQNGVDALGNGAIRQGYRGLKGNVTGSVADPGANGAIAVAGVNVPMRNARNIVTTTYVRGAAAAGTADKLNADPRYQFIPSSSQHGVINFQDSFLPGSDINIVGQIAYGDGLSTQQNDFADNGQSISENLFSKLIQVDPIFVNGTDSQGDLMFGNSVVRILDEAGGTLMSAAITDVHYDDTSFETPVFEGTLNTSSMLLSNPGGASRLLSNWMSDRAAGHEFRFVMDPSIVTETGMFMTGSTYSIDSMFSIVTVPEPASLLTLAVGSLVLLFRRNTGR